MAVAFRPKPTDDRRERVMEWLRDHVRPDESAIARAELVASRSGQPVEQVLNQMGKLSDRDLAEAYGKIAGMELWDPAADPPTLDIGVYGFTADFLRRNRVLPITAGVDGAIICAAVDPLNDEAMAGLAFGFGGDVRVLVAEAGHFRAAIDQALASDFDIPAVPDERRLEREIDQVSNAGFDGEGARIVAAAFDAAIARGASDIHFEPRQHDLRIRFRVDGRLTDYRTIAADLARPCVSRLKVIANLDLGEHRLPQDGRSTFVVSGRQIDVRLATSPNVYGESAVLRILDRRNVPLDLDALGFNPATSATFRKAIARPNGLFLVTGPTGSGKTTTLYALLQMFSGTPRKVLSVEDPVEFHFEHVSQTQVKEDVGLTFPVALRSFLRQDPDVILVGEIRDRETAAVAFQAAMTGHLVLASLHANDALAAIPRLLDLGIEPYQLTHGLQGAGAQRLVRKLCPHCRQEYEPDAVEHEQLARAGVASSGVLFGASGCSECQGEGFRGRVAIGEVFLADSTFLRGAVANAAPGELTRLAEACGYIPMLRDGAEKAVTGLTSLSEVVAAVHA